MALRQLQDQLAAAYKDIATCQEENAALRADSKEMIQAQHAEVVSSEKRAVRAEQDLEGMHGLLRELKTALEATLVDNAKCKAEVAQLAELKLALESCRVALGEAKRRERDADERAAAAGSAQRRAEAAAAAAERRASDAECLRREGSSAAAHAHSKLQTLEQSLQDQKSEVERLGRSNALLQFRCDAAEARADALQADAAQAASKHETEISSLKEKLKEEEHKRREGEQQALRMDTALTALRQEATALRLAAEEHAKGVFEMRVTAEAAQRFLDQERGMRDALTNALQHTETTMQRVLSLNQALVESFAEPFILASGRQQQQMLPPDQDARGNAAECIEASSSQRVCANEQQQQLQQSDMAGAKAQVTAAAPEDREREAHVPAQLERLKMDGCLGWLHMAPGSTVAVPCQRNGCPKCLVEQNRPDEGRRAGLQPQSEADEGYPHFKHIAEQQAGSGIQCLHEFARLDEENLEHHIMPAIARHMAELHNQQQQSEKVASQAQPKQAARLRAAATFTISSAAPGQKPGITGSAAQPRRAACGSSTARRSWGVPPARKPTLATGGASRSNPTLNSGARKAGTIGKTATQNAPSPLDLLKTRAQVEAVVMSLEDELAVLDLRYAELLRQQQQQRHCRPHASSNDIDLGEEVAHAAAKAREAMQRKGRQIQQLRQYSAHLTC
ncbi:g2327 [Coccomyxa elongata]